MATTFGLKMLPALNGDCMILTWGDDGALHHMIVDGGKKSAYLHLFDELSTIKKPGERSISTCSRTWTPITSKERSPTSTT